MKQGLEKVKAALRRFMEGRYGPDQLGTAVIWISLLVSLVGAFTRVPVLQLIAWAGLIYCIYRMFSRDRAKRSAENQAFLKRVGGIATRGKQFIQRRKNRKEYKYFRCPHCRVLIRLRRGQGQVHGKCPRCQTEYDQKT